MTDNGNAVDYFIDRHLREGRGDRLAVADPWRSLTYAELAADSARFAAGLRAAGIKRERRIALVMLDTVDFPIAFWGALRAGVVAVPINTLLPADITGYILGDSRAAALVVSAPLLDPLRPELKQLGLGRTMAYQLVARHEIPFVRIGRCVRVPRNELAAWIATRIVEPIGLGSERSRS